MQATQLLTSSQLASAPLQLPLEMFGQLAPKPIDASVSSSLPVPQLRSLPPHFWSIALRSLRADFAIWPLAFASGQGPADLPAST